MPDYPAPVRIPPAIADRLDGWRHRGRKRQGGLYASQLAKLLRVSVGRLPALARAAGFEPPAPRTKWKWYRVKAVTEVLRAQQGARLNR